MENKYNFSAWLCNAAYPIDMNTGNTVFCFDFSVKGMCYLEDFMDICKEDYDIKILKIFIMDRVKVDGEEYRTIDVMTDLQWEEYMNNS